MITFESIHGNMGERHGNVKESGSNGLETAQKTSEILCRSQRGHSRLRVGKPSTWRRATAYQVPQSTFTPNVKAWEPLPMSVDRKRG
jgi:hypothetical protein